MGLALSKYIIQNPDDVKNMCKDLRAWVKRAASEAVNETAYVARENIIKAASQSMTIRSNFLTSRRVLTVSRAPFKHTDSLRDIQASVGFTASAEFMARQDQGGWHEPKSGDRLKIHTDKAREGGVKTGLVKRGYRYTKNSKKMIIPLITKGRSHVHKQVIRAAVAKKTGMLMYFNRSLFRITKFGKVNGRPHFEKEMIINRKYSRTYTKARNFFMPACNEAAANIQELFNKNMERLM